MNRSARCIYPIHQNQVLAPTMAPKQIIAARNNNYDSHKPPMTLKLFTYSGHFKVLYSAIGPSACLLGCTGSNIVHLPHRPPTCMTRINQYGGQGQRQQIIL